MIDELIEMLGNPITEWTEIRNDRHREGIGTGTGEGQFRQMERH
jgi:hypothetical protein